MSWQSYADNVGGYPEITDSLICGLDGNPWATKGAPKATVPELQALVKVCQTGSGSGITVGGLKYTFIRCNDKVADFKGKASEDGGNPANAFSFALSGTAGVLALHQEAAGASAKQGLLQATNFAATSVRDYLLKNKC